VHAGDGVLRLQGDHGLSKLTQENQGSELVLTEPWKREKRRRRGVDGEVRAAVTARLVEEVDAGVPQAPRLHGSTCGAPAKPAEGSAGPVRHRRRAIAAASRLTRGGVLEKSQRVPGWS
jgi:hypothetical protein